MTLPRIFGGLWCLSGAVAGLACGAIAEIMAAMAWSSTFSTDDTVLLLVLFAGGLLHQALGLGVGVAPFLPWPRVRQLAMVGAAGSWLLALGFVALFPALSFGLSGA
jgi:hypothetical protein